MVRITKKNEKLKILFLPGWSACWLIIPSWLLNNVRATHSIRYSSVQMKIVYNMKENDTENSTKRQTMLSATIITLDNLSYNTDWKLSFLQNCSICIPDLAS